MNHKDGNDIRRERLAGALLFWGTWIASAMIAVGVALGLAHLTIPGLTPDGAMKAGIALFIFLPVARVLLMLASFLRERDFLYSAISAIVLGLILAGILAAL